MEDEFVDEDFDDYETILNHARGDLEAVGPEITGQFAPAEETLGPEPGLGEKIGDYLIDRVVPEVWDAFTHEVSLGSSELSKALMGREDPFVLYGKSLDPLDTYDVGSPQQSYDDMLRDASTVWGRGQDQEMER